MSKRVLAYACLLVLVAMPGFSANLDLTPLHKQIQFNFGNPGARSLGMGGAFLGRADDASAAEANPAGLTIIAKPEFTIEIGQTELTSSVPTGTSGNTEVSNDVGPNATFVSVVAPVRNFVLSGYYHRPLDFEQSGNFPGTFDNLGFGYRGGPSSIHYQMETLGVAGAWKLASLSVGAALRYQRFDPVSSAVLLNPNGSTFGSVESSGKDSDLGYSLGLRWSSESDAIGIGAVYKSSSSFAFEESFTPTGGAREPNETGLETPDILGVGVSFRPHEGLTLNLDVNRIGYSNLLKNFDPAIPCNLTPGDASCYDVSDATEVHVGVEWARPNSQFPIALRAGFWRDPGHTPEWHGTTEPYSALAARLFPEAEDQNHVSVGVGYLGGSFEVNAAYDHADINSKASVSFLKRF